jgi:predicted helicase
MNPTADRIKSIINFKSLVKYLHEELDWPLDDDNIEDLVFDYDPEEVGLDAKLRDKVKSIKQLRPLVTGQPWGIFYIEFSKEQLPVVVLRRILRALVIKKRAAAGKSEQAVWRLNDLLFISALGEEEHRGMAFAHFRDKGEGLPQLRAFSWDERETHFHYLRNDNLERLRWPQSVAKGEVWKERWSDAFTGEYREGVGTAKQLSQEMARIATRTRDLVKQVLPLESERTGKLKQLFKAFQRVLIHDLTTDSFADMIAQTVAYGLFTACVTDDKVLGLEHVESLIPKTSPFLKELFAQLIEATGHRRNQLDVDELGLSELVELLNKADMHNVLKDFGRQTGGGREDPIIHFYEEFLKAYDKKQKVKRGEFYTPLPVVSYIVRSVHEILKTEFKLELGLADTTTWGEMREKFPDLKIPEGVSPDEPFVQILDPATGTGTFLAFTIELIHDTMREHWQKQGKKELEIKRLWN